MSKDGRMAERRESEEEDGLKKKKLEKLGELCASLGLQPSRMTEKMLSTIELSKDIEKNQRDVIKKLSSTSPRVQEEEEEEGGQSIVVDDNEADENDGEMQLNRVGKSLKRKRVPPPLTISQSNSTTASLHGSGGGSGMSFAKSAPAHLPNFPRSSVDRKFPALGKPKVQYLGKVSSGAPQRDSPIQSSHAYKLKTPYLSCFPNYPVPPPVPGAAMGSYGPYYPYGYPGQLPLFQSTPQQLYNAPMMTPWQPRSAVPYASQARYHRETSSNSRRGRQHNTHQAKRARTKGADEDLRGNKSRDSENDSGSQTGDNEQEREPDAENAEDTESAHLAIEDDPKPFPSSEPHGPNVFGEIRISGNVFSYEFPSHRSSIDKKMFMSICDKVWDESQRLANGSSPY